MGPCRRETWKRTTGWNMTDEQNNFLDQSNHFSLHLEFLLWISKNQFFSSKQSCFRKLLPLSGRKYVFGFVKFNIMYDLTYPRPYSRKLCNILNAMKILWYTVIDSFFACIVRKSRNKKEQGSFYYFVLRSQYTQHRKYGCVFICVCKPFLKSFVWDVIFFRS